MSAWPELKCRECGEHFRISERNIVAAVLDHAVIGPGRRGYNRFDPARVTPVWRA
jgi:hypothetical protein